MSPANAEPIACPHCGVGVAYPIELAETGTKYKCLSCGWGGAQAASADDEAGKTLISDAIAGPRTMGHPAPGNLTYEGEHPGYATPSKHPDAGPAVKPRPIDKPTPTSGPPEPVPAEEPV